MNVWDRFKSNIPPRHRLGLWLSRRKLWTRAFVPSRRDRVDLRGKQPFWVVFGALDSNNAQGGVAIAANQTKELRYVCQNDFIWCTGTVSTSVGGTASNPGVRIRIRDLSTQPGKGKKFSLSEVNDINLAGSAQDSRFLRKPYRFHAGRIIAVSIKNLQSSTNNVQLVLEGVQDV
jgi:hypothetical protein